MVRLDKMVIISGSRDWEDERPIREFLLQFDPYWTELVHGKCRGADMVADKVGRSLGFIPVMYPANWKRDKRGNYDPAAGNDRNREMAILGMRVQRYGVEVHAGVFPLPQSKGTWNMLDLCKMGGFIIHMPESCKSYM